MKFYLKKTATFIFTLAFIAFIIPISASAVMYQPGETLNPACLPTDIDCGVTLNVGTGIIGQMPYYSSAGTSLTATSTIFIATNGNIGIGTTSPWRALSVTGSSDLGANALAGSFTATSTTATSTFAGGIQVGGLSGLTVDRLTGNVGIGSSTPSGLLSIQKSWSSSNDFKAIYSNISTDDFGTSNIYAGYFKTVLNDTGHSGSGNRFGIYGEASGPGFGGMYGVYGNANGGDVNWAGYFNQGNVGIVNDLQVEGGIGIGTYYSPDFGGSVLVPDGSLGVSGGIISGGVLDGSLAILDSTSEQQVLVNSNGDSYFNAGNIGIGTSTPQAKLSVKGIGTTFGKSFAVYNSNDVENLTMLDSGKLGIATTSPWRALSVTGSSDLGSNALAGTFTSTTTMGMATSTFANGLQLSRSSTQYLTLYSDSVGNTISADTGAGSAKTFNINSNNEDIRFKINSTTRLNVDLNGFIGIGANITSPTSLVDIASTTPSNIVNMFSVRAGADIDANKVVINGSGRLGIGTSSPSAKLSITGVGASTGRAFAVADSNNAEKLTLLDNGNLGLGTTSPYQLLSVSGNAIITGNITTGLNCAGNVNSGKLTVGANGVITCADDVGGGGGGGTIGTGTTGYIPYYESDGTTLTATSTIFFGSNQYVGIGNTSPDYMLTLGTDSSNYGAISVNQGPNLVSKFSRSSTQYLEIFSNTTANGIKSIAGGDSSKYLSLESDPNNIGIRLRTNGQNRLSVDNNGIIGIGTVYPESNRRMTLAGESGSLSIADAGTLASENLSNYHLSDGEVGTPNTLTNWALTSGCVANLDSTVTCSGASDSITQDSGDFAVPGIASRWYVLEYVYTINTGVPTATITNSFAYANTSVILNTSVTLNGQSQTGKTYFLSSTTPSHFVMSVDTSSGKSITFESISLKEMIGGTIYSGSGTSGLTITRTGNIGIGTTSPFAKLSISGSNASGYGLNAPYAAVIYGGTGGDNSGDDIVGMGGGINIVSGNGGGSSGGGVVGIGGVVNIIGGTGGEGDNTGTGGTGGQINIVSGNGSSERAGGNGGDLVLGAGNGGNGLVINDATFSGNGGNVYINSGAPGDTADIIGSYGNIVMNQNGGNVGIATTSPWKTFSVNGTVSLAGLTGASGSSPNALCLDANNQVVVNNAQTCTVSSQRYKNSITELSSGLDTINKLRPVSFKYNGNDTEHVGFIAEDVEKVDPRLMFYDASSTPQGVRYEEMTAVLAKAIQELNTKVNNISNLPSTTNNLASTISSLSEWVGEKITATVGIFTNLKTENLEISNGIQMKDSSTGEMYCVRITNGEWQKNLGNCDSIQLAPVYNGGQSVPVENTQQNSTTTETIDSNVSSTTETVIENQDASTLTENTESNASTTVENLENQI